MSGYLICAIALMLMCSGAIYSQDLMGGSLRPVSLTVQPPNSASTLPIPVTPRQPDVKIIQILDTPYGTEYILEIKGTQFRGINATHARQIEANKIQLEGALKQLDISASRLNLADSQRSTLEALLERSEAMATNNLDQATTWKSIAKIQEARAERAEVLAKKSKLATFFDKPLVVLLTRVGLPTISLLLTIIR